MNGPAIIEAQTSSKARFPVAEFVEICSAMDARLELVDGELERMNPPVGTHTALQSRIVSMLFRPFDERAAVEVGVQIDDDYADVRTLRFGEPLAVPGTDATIVIA